MGLLLRHPRIPSCAVCQKYVVDYDVKTGRGSGEPEKAKWTGDPEALHERPKDDAPPCHVCPKKGPEFEYRFQLKTKNWKTLKLWQETRATFGRSLSEAEARDPILRHNFAILDTIFDSIIRERQTDAIADGVTGAVRIAMLARK